jgi:hypothetical protein
VNISRPWNVFVAKSMRTRILSIAALVALLAFAACGGDNLKFPGRVFTPTPAPTAIPTATPQF